MNDNEPHRVIDDEPAGEPTKSRVYRRVLSKKKKIVVPVDFDDSIKEFEFWNYIYDLREQTRKKFDFETTPDYKNRIQYYEITASATIISKIELWLTTNEFKYKLDKP